MLTPNTGARLVIPTVTASSDSDRPAAKRKNTSLRSRRSFATSLFTLSRNLNINNPPPTTQTRTSPQIISVMAWATGVSSIGLVSVPTVKRMSTRNIQTTQISIARRVDNLTLETDLSNRRCSKISNARMPAKD